MRTATLLVAAMLTITVGAEAQETCTVARIVDGDPFVCTDSARVRLLLIDAPELSQEPYGRRAAEALSELLPVGSVVELEQDVQPLDRYGRTLAHIRMAADRQPNLEMVRRGYAVVSVYPPNVRHVERFRAARDSARAERKGFCAIDVLECEPAEQRRGRCE